MSVSKNEVTVTPNLDVTISFTGINSYGHQSVLWECFIKFIFDVKLLVT